MAVDFFTLVTNADALLSVLGSLDKTVAYAILFAVYSLETGVAPVSFLPGNSLLFLCGTLTMTAVFAFGTLFAVLSVAAFVGNLLSYETGAFLGAQSRGQGIPGRQCRSPYRGFPHLHGIARYVGHGAHHCPSSLNV